MKKKVWKGILSLLLITTTVLSLSACGGKKVSKEDAALLSGKWDMILLESDGVKVTAEEAGGSISLEFQKNGKATLTTEEGSQDCKWEKDDTLITVWLKDGAVWRGHTATWEDGYFIWYWDNDGTPMKLYFAREGSDPSQYMEE